MKTMYLPRTSIALAFLLAIAALDRQAWADTHVWVGGVDDKWSTPGNWTGGAPQTPGNENGPLIVEFGSGSTSVCDVAVKVSLLHFKGGGNLIKGDGSTILSLTGEGAITNLQNDAGTNTLGGATAGTLLPLHLTGSSVVILSITGKLVVPANIDGDASVAMNGTTATDSLELQGVNTFSTDFQLNSGTLLLNTPAAAGSIISSLTLGTGSSSPKNAILRLLQDDVVGDNLDLTVNADGWFDVNGKTDTMGGMTSIEGLVTLANGKLTTNGDVNLYPGGSITVGGGTLTCLNPLFVEDSTITLGTSTLTGTLNVNAALGMQGGSIQLTAGTKSPDVVNLNGDVQTRESTVSASFINAKVTLNATTRTFGVATGAFQPQLVLNGEVAEGSVTGSGLRKVDVGTMIMQATKANTFTGTTTVDRGTLQLNNTGTPAAAGKGSAILGPIVLGNSLDAVGSAVLQDIAPNQIANDKALFFNKSGQLSLNNQSETFPSIGGAGIIDLGDTGSGGSITFGSDGSDISYSGLIKGVGTFTKVGAGTLTFTGTSVSNGSIVIAAGKMILNSLSLNQASSRTLVIGSGTGAVASFNNDGTIASTASVELGRANQLPNDGIVVVNSDGGLDTKNFFDRVGTVTINRGIVSIGSAQMEVMTDLALNGGTFTASNAGNLSLFGEVHASVAVASSTITSPILLNSTVRFTVTAGAVQPELSVVGTIGEASVGQGLTKTGMGTMENSGSVTNSYTGVTTVDQGTLKLNHNVVNSGTSGNSVNGSVVIGNGTDAAGSAVLIALSASQVAQSAGFTVNASGKYDLNNRNEKIGSLASTSAGGTVALGTANLTVGDASSTEYLGGFSGVGNLIKIGAGTLAVGGTSSLSGSTTVQAGALLINGSLLNSPVTVSSGATLGGSGSVGTATASTNGTIRPGLLTGGALGVTGDLDLTSGKFSVAIDDSKPQQSSRTAVTGALKLNAAGGTPLTFSVTGTVAQGPYVIASYGTLAGTFNTSSLPSGYILTYHYNDGVSSNNIALYTQVVTLAATNVYGGSATLNGTATVSGGPATAHFEYGTSISYGTSTPAFNLGAAADPFSVPMTEDLTGLSPNTDYHFRLVVQPDGGGSPLNGADMTFRTQNAPAAVTLPATNIATGGAKLNGTITPLGTKSTYYFEYGPTKAYGFKTTTINNLLGTVAVPNVPVSFTLTGLYGGRTYHFRLVGTYGILNNTSYGVDMAFTTLGPVVATLPASSVSALSAVGNGTVNPGGKSTSVYFEFGTTTAYGTKTASQSIGSGVAAVNVISALNNSVVKLLKFDTTYHYRIVATNSAGVSKGDDVSFHTVLVVPPRIVTQPTPKLAALGSSVTFSVVVSELVPTDSIPTYQWRKGGTNILGATSASYTIPAVTTALANVYDCVIKNAASINAATTTTSTQVNLGVVDTADKALTQGVGTTAVMAVNNGGTNLTFAWKRGASTLTPGGRVSIAGKTATITSLQSGDTAPGDSDTYTCTITASYLPASPLTAKFVLKVFDGAPEIIGDPVVMDDGIVSGAYTFQIPINPDSKLTPTSYSVTGLPKGLTFDSVKGLIYGNPQLASAFVAGNYVPFAVKLKAINAINAKSTAPARNATLIVRPLPTKTVGTFNGLVDRDAGLGGGYGGKVTVTVSSIGSITGTIGIGAESLSFTGKVAATTSSTTSTATGITVTRTKPLPAATLNLTFNGDTGKLTGDVSVGLVAGPVNLEGWINPWNKTSNIPPLAASYTAALDMANAGLSGTDVSTIPPGDPANVVYPQGTGYATVTVGSDGSAKWVGKMGDGTVTSFSTTMSVDGKIPVHQMFYTNLGSVHGWVTATADSVATPANNGLPLLDGTINWNKNAPLVANKDRIYQAGFPKIDITVAGGKYVAPLANTSVIGITAEVAPTRNARLVFTEGGLKSPTTAPTSIVPAAAVTDLEVTVTKTNTVAVPAATANFTGLTMTITAGTGAMSGGFTLKDPDPTKPLVTTPSLSRAVTYSGVLVTRASVNKGLGVFLLSELTSTTTKTLTTTAPQLAGQVVLEKK